jgi:hypothetical protein
MAQIALTVLRRHFFAREKIVGNFDVAGFFWEIEINCGLLGVLIIIEIERHKILLQK